MPASPQKLKKKCLKRKEITNQQAIDFAQLILDIFKDKKQI